MKETRETKGKLTTLDGMPKAENEEASQQQQQTEEEQQSALQQEAPEKKQSPLDTQVRHVERRTPKMNDKLKQLDGIPRAPAVQCHGGEAMIAPVRPFKVGTRMTTRFEVDRMNCLNTVATAGEIEVNDKLRQLDGMPRDPAVYGGEAMIEICTQLCSNRIM